MRPLVDGGRRKDTIEKKLRVNEKIRTREVRVIGQDGTQLGIMSPDQALRIAQEGGLDLVEVSPDAVPPVCRILDYGKYRYQLNKKAQEAKKKQKVIQVKEVKFRPKTDEHDYEFKKNNIIRFLTKGKKVKATVIFRGRENMHRDIGYRILTRLRGEVGEFGVVETEPRQEGPFLDMILAPKKWSGQAPAPSPPGSAAEKISPGRRSP
jgi:translation initiation factor IF-3